MLSLDMIVKGPAIPPGAAVPCSADPDLWFPDTPAEYDRAVRICQRCHYQTECADFGKDQAFGVWGGKMAGGYVGQTCYVQDCYREAAPTMRRCSEHILEMTCTEPDCERYTYTFEHCQLHRLPGEKPVRKDPRFG